MGVIDRYATGCRSGPDTPRPHARRGQHAARALARGSSEKLGVELYFKFEGMNPTGSFKDRGMCVAVAKAVEDGYEGIVCASTGNTAASAAAYARARRPDGGRAAPGGRDRGREVGAVARGRRARARGPRQLRRRAASCLELAERGAFMLVNSLNPHRIEGQKTAAFEIVEELGRAPDVLALPYGGGGNTSRTRRASPRRARRRGIVSVQAAERAVTLASAIRIAEPAHLDEVDELDRERPRRDRHRRRRGDHRRVARDREPRGHLLRAVVGRGLRGARARRARARAARSSCVLTGHGLKDTAAVDVLAERDDRRRAERRVDPRRGAMLGAGQLAGVAPAGRSVTAFVAAHVRPSGPDTESVPSRSGRTVTIVVRAPATTANLGPGFDCAPRRSTSGTSWSRRDRARPTRLPRGRGRRRAAAERGAPGAARVRARRAGRGPQLPLREPHPARARARLVRRDDRGRARRRARGRRPRRLARRGARARPAARGPRRQPRAGRLRRRLPELAERHRPHAHAPARDRPAARADRGRAGHAREHRGLARPAAGVRHRTPTPPRRARRPRCSARPSPPATPTCSPPRSTTCCTSRTASRTRRCSPSCATTRCPGTAGVTLSGSGPSVVVWAAKADAAAVAAALDRAPSRRARPAPCHRRPQGAAAA